jgi:hypothetical protein
MQSTRRFGVLAAQPAWSSEPWRLNIELAFRAAERGRSLDLDPEARQDDENSAMQSLIKQDIRTLPRCLGDQDADVLCEWP